MVKSLTEMKVRIAQMTPEERAEWETLPPQFDAAQTCRMNPWNPLHFGQFEAIFAQGLDPMTLWVTGLEPVELPIKEVLHNLAAEFAKKTEHLVPGEA